MIRIGRHLFLIVWLALFILPSIAQEQTDDLEEQYRCIIERPMGVAPAISSEVWDKLIGMALNAPTTSVSLQTTPTTILVMRLDPEQTRCSISVSDILTYELIVAPWRIEGERPLLQITTLKQPCQTSILTAFLPEQDKIWELSTLINPTDWLSGGGNETISTATVASSWIEKMPVVLTFAPEQPGKVITICASPSLEGWCTREQTEELKKLITSSPIYYRLTQRGALQRVK